MTVETETSQKIGVSTGEHLKWNSKTRTVKREEKKTQLISSFLSLKENEKEKRNDDLTDHIFSLQFV